jgi:hypothetical protein
MSPVTPTCVSELKTHVSVAKYVLDTAPNWYAVHTSSGLTRCLSLHCSVNLPAPIRLEKQFPCSSSSFTLPSIRLWLLKRVVEHLVRGTVAAHRCHREAR